MRILKVDYRNNLFEVIPDNLDDLWHLERIIVPGDVVSGKTERKIKGTEEGMRQSKESIFVEIEAERIEFHESSGDLRVMGVIVSSPSGLVELKAHHTLEVFPGKRIKVKKRKLKKYQVQRLEKAKIASGRDTTLLVVLDDEEAEFALLKEFSFEKKGRILASKSGKRFKGVQSKQKFFEKIQKKVLDVAPQKVIFAGPGFTKTDLKKFLEENDVKIEMHFESINSVGVTGLNELLKSGIIDKIVAEIQLVKETKLVEKILEEIAKPEGLCTVDLEKIKTAILLGAVEHLLIADEFLLSQREQAEDLMEQVEKTNGEIHILSVKNDSGKKLKGFGGVAAILRFNPA